MIIYCDNEVAFIYTIAKLVERGLTFDAFTSTFEIHLTGGY